MSQPKNARISRKASTLTDELIAKIDSKDPVRVLAQMVTSLTGVAADLHERLAAVEEHLDEADRGWRSPHLRGREVR